MDRTTPSPNPEPFVFGLIRDLATSLLATCRPIGMDREDIEQELHLVWSERRHRHSQSRGTITTFAKAVLTRAAESLRRNAKAAKRGSTFRRRELLDVPLVRKPDLLQVQREVRTVLASVPVELREVGKLLLSGSSERAIARTLRCPRRHVQAWRTKLRRVFREHDLHLL